MTLQRISMKQLEDPKYQEEKLILQWMSEHLHFSIASQDVLVDFKEKYVKVRSQLYYYHILHEGSQAHIWVTMKRGNFDVAFSEVPKDRKKATLKSHKGRVRATKATFLLLSAVSISLVAVSLKSSYVVETPLIMESSLGPEDDVDNVIEATSKVDVGTDETLQTENEAVSVASSLEDVSMEVTPNISSTTTIISAEPVITNTNREAKRAETDELYGDYILEYSTRYGQPYALVAALLTQERSDNPNDELRVRQNIGQLTTTAICGEKIVAPVFSNGELQGYDKIYVLPPCYDDYPLEDLDTMGHFPGFSEEEQQKIQEAIRLKEEGYQIYRRCDAFYNTENNIHISVAYLAYVGNMKQDLVKEVMSYHAGYVKVANDLSNDDILNGNVDAEDPNYVGHVFQYLRLDELKSLTLYLTDGENTRVVSYEIQPSEFLNEETGYHL